MVLECVPPVIAAAVTKAIDVPTIGIGAGPHCSGQVHCSTGNCTVGRVSSLSCAWVQIRLCSHQRRR